MKTSAVYLFSVLFYCCSQAYNLSGPQVYVVTPSTKLKTDEGRSAPQPFYYHNWMRRMDSPQNKSTTTTATPVKTPDLIFAEFEADNMKNIKKLLEKEIKSKATSTTTTTAKPIYVADEENQYSNSDYGLPTPAKVKEEVRKDTTDYFALYNNMYDSNNHAPAVYQPRTTTTTQKTTLTTKKVEGDKIDKTDYFALYNNLYNANAQPSPIYLPSTSNPISTTTSTTTTADPPNVENIWHIIDSQKHDQYAGQWEEVSIDGVKDENNKVSDEEIKNEKAKLDNIDKNNDGNIYDNFALPGFGTKPGSGENESRAIRTEPNIRFPYVNLKPLQVKGSKNPINNMFFYNQKKNNMFTNLDNFMEVKNPVRGEVEDVGLKHQMTMPVDRYNPAQPYLPGPTEYGSKTKQSSPPSNPVKTYANLVPPPPPPPPKVTANDFPAPSTYDSFPPFATPSDSALSAPPVSKPMPPIIQPSIELSSPDLGAIDSDGPNDSGYQYKRPPPPSFLPTVPPRNKPFGGYSYDRPPMVAEAPPADMDDKPEFQGYNYDKPTPVIPEKPALYGYHHDKPDFPLLPKDQGSSFDHHGPHDSDYPELVFDKPHGSMGNVKGSDDMKGDAMGMVPPPMADTNPGPVEDSGFQHDFPGDFKYHHDFDDHDFYHHHHHHHHPTTTTTTETPRVNRFSYYYLGKKLYYLPLYFSVYFIVYVAALIIKAVLRHKIVYPNSWRPNNQAATFFSKRSIESMDFSSENLHDITGRVTHAIATAAERYMKERKKIE